MKIQETLKDIRAKIKDLDLLINAQSDIVLVEISKLHGLQKKKRALQIKLIGRAGKLK